MDSKENPEFELGGIHHLALVSRDMARTVDFYTNVLGMPLVKTIEFPEKSGQHFFFDVGNGDCLAFFWFPGAPEPEPGVSSPKALPGVGDIVTAVASMNHVAFNVPSERIDEYHQKLKDKGIEVAEILNHDDSLYGVTRDLHPGVFVRSIYFFDPDGIMLEFAAWTRTFTEDDVAHEPARALDANSV